MRGKGKEKKRWKKSRQERKGRTGQAREAAFWPVSP